jgi:hypothetical protein
MAPAQMVVLRSLEDELPIDFGCVCLHQPAGALNVVCVGAKSEALARQLEMPEQSAGTRGVGFGRGMRPGIP